MKTKRIDWLLIGAVALAMGACSQEDDLLSDNNDFAKEGKRLFNFEASVDADTRTTFNADYSGLTWVEGDQLGFFTDAGDNNVLSNEYEGDNRFTAELSANAAKVYAYYPYQSFWMINNDGTKSFYVNIPDLQSQQQAGVLNGAYQPLYAQADLSSDYTRLAFRPLASLVAFNIYDSTGGNEEKIGCVSFSTAESAVMNGGIGFEVTTGNQKAFFDDKSLGIVTLDVHSEIPQTKPTDKAGYIYLAVNPIVYSNNRFVVYTDKHSYTFTNDKEIDLTNPYNVQTVTLNLANAEKKELDDLNNCFEDANFLNYLLENFDLNKDGRLSSFEANRVESIYCAGMSIKSLKGIELFTNITNLWCYSNQLTSLDVSNCKKLEILECSSNQLTSLDVSNCKKLEILECSSNQLTSLNVSDCEGLQDLACYENQLTSLDVSKNVNLKYLSCAYNQLTSLDVSKNVNLMSLSCGSNQLTSLDVSKNVNLKYLSCYSNQLTSLDASNCVKLTNLECQSNLLTNLNVNNCSGLQYLYCSKNQLTSLSVSSCGNLSRLECINNQLTSLDLSNCGNLTELYCFSNQLTSLNVSYCKSLNVISCHTNKLTDLDVSNCAKEMVIVYCINQTMPEGTVFKFTKAVGQTIGYLALPDGAETIEK